MGKNTLVSAAPRHLSPLIIPHQTVCPERREGKKRGEKRERFGLGENKCEENREDAGE